MTDGYGPVKLAHSEQHILSSQIVGDSFQISVGLPVNYDAGKKTCPVVYVLDANIFFGMVLETARLLQTGNEIPECVIVGIGYPDHEQHLGLRIRDLTPCREDESNLAWLKKVSQGRKVPIAYRGSGRAQQFLRFIGAELMPFLQARYRIDPDTAILAGDSLGGLFALYALFHQPDLFTGYIVGSPSIYYGNAVTFDFEAAYAASHDDLQASVFLAVGALEAVYEPAHAGMVSNAVRLAEILGSRHYPGLTLTMQVFDQETHFSVIPSTMSRGLRCVF